MGNQIYLALYKGRSKNLIEWVEDWLIRVFTKGQYSHCEIAVKKSKDTNHYNLDEWFECYTSSPRDGGVRCKVIDVDNRDKWDLIPLNNVTESQIKAFFEQTKGKKYDLLGAIGVVFKNRQRTDKYFCSEWCAELLGFKEPWRFSPNDLSVVVKSRRF